MTWWMSGWGWLCAIAVAAVTIGLIVWAIARSSRHGRPRDPATSDVLGALEERFARGEIDPEEFERRRTALRDEA